ncbi:hypothetical protein BCR36DRAFT_340225 [Piromyces finnis]|uniref:FCH-domain-containing protein n=1 Tax=Piromyces finnis TaxID=1754191 RepID=A0A1Y1UKP6_9FUNG|nr:hypothetical protein BCR36DRAFT_340225 [Piromyces finnis]|eukprot:ORX38107.1 hypothetical protein BCR36DRAFT_340225 [Piromyces finnis]
MSFGSELQDIQAVNSYLINDLAFIQEFRDTIKERISIEKDYIHKLENLQKKCSQKNDKRGLTLTVGSVKLPNGDTVIPKNSTFQKSYDKFLKKFEESIKDRNDYVEKLNSLSENIKLSVVKKEEIRKKHLDYSSRINTEITNMCTEADKNETKFREACNNTDAMKKKIEKNEDEKSKKIYDQNIIDMNNKMNMYILSIKVANAYNDKLVNVENKNVLDNMQELHESLVEYYKSICKDYLDSENELMEKLKSTNNKTVDYSNKIDLSNDIALFIQYNKKEWKSPEVKTFATIPLWKTTGDIYTKDINAITFLRNTSLKLQQNLSIIKDDINSKNKELEGINSVYQTYKATPSFGDPNEIYQKVVDAKKEIALLQLEELKCEVQINAISEAIGGTEMEIIPHNFKNKNFIKQTVCSCCGESLWRKGLSCRECGYSCHLKCELNVPPNCTKQKLPKNKRATISSYPSSEKKSISTIPTSVTVSQLSTYSSKSVQPTSKTKNPFLEDDTDDDDDDVLDSANPFSSSSDLQIDLPTMIAAYDYTKQINDEVDLHAGEEVTIIEPDKGDGWIKVSCSSGTGLVPANYLVPSNSSDKKEGNYTTSNNDYSSPFMEVIKQAKVIYDYTGQMDEELTVTHNDIVTFIENSEPGWIKVKNETNGRIGLIPESYVEYIST